MNGRSILIIFLFLILTLFSFFITSKWLDPDFGWHLRTGELILERGVPQVDWYSYTMPDFPWIDHEWLTDVLIFKIHSLFGPQILLLFFLIISTIAFFISIRSRYLWYCLPPLFIGYFASLPFFGARPQLLTVFFAAILIKILDSFLANPASRLIYPAPCVEAKRSTQKLSQGYLAKTFSKLWDIPRCGIYFCPILFLIWVNLHGGFFAGLFILFLILILEIFKKTNIFKQITSWKRLSGQNFQKHSSREIVILLIVSAVSCLATLINPYGIRIYEEVFRTIGDSYLSFHIAEWLPLFSTGLSVFGILYLSLFLGLLIPQYKKIELNKLILSIIFLIFALLHQRHFPLFIILTIPIFAEILFHTRQAVNPKRFQFLFGGSKKWVAILFVLGLTVYGLYPFLATFNQDISFSYPQKAVPFLKNLPLSENLLNDYGWGGYLIWKAPERKVFIDGRMPSWRRNTQFVFGDYVKIMKAEENFQELLERYDVKIALLKKERKTEAESGEQLKSENKLSNFLKKQNWFWKILGIRLSEKNIYQELSKAGWKVIYEDETAVILRR